MKGGRTLVFCKAPVAGRVKTRLIAQLGAPAAAALHAELAARLIGQLPPETTDIWCTPDASHAFFQAYRRQGYALHRQEGADLGERMAHALGSALAQPGTASAALVGTDCPTLDAAYIAAAHRALQGCEVALGPAEDGGYGLIAMKRPQPIFAGVNWGSAQVLAQTRALLEAQQIRYQLLPSLWDLDRPEDHQRWLQAKEPRE